MKINKKLFTIILLFIPSILFSYDPLFKTAIESLNLEELRIAISKGAKIDYIDNQSIIEGIAYSSTWYNQFGKEKNLPILSDDEIQLRTLAMYSLAFSKGAKFDSRDNDILISFAYRDTFPLVISYLAGKGANVNISESSSGSTPLSYAYQQGNENTAKILIALGAFPIEKTELDFLRMMRAIEIGDYNEMNTLLKIGVNINKISKYGKQTLLGSIIRMGFNLDENRIQWLLENGANPNLKGQGDMLFSPIHWAAQAYEYENKEILGLLLKYGADINSTNSYQAITPLHLAVERNYIQTVKELLRLGARKDIKDGRGLLPIDLSKNSQITNMLQ